MVGYSTWSGTTHEVATFIAESLQAQGFETNTLNLKIKNIPVADYDAFILGTSIHAGKPVNSFVNFLRMNHELIRMKPTAFFIVCANMYQDTPENREETLQWIHDAIKDIPEISLLDIGLFGGAVLTSGEDYDKLLFLIKPIIKGMKKSVVEKLGHEDFRDWDKIKKWTADISGQIKKTP